MEERVEHVVVGEYYEQVMAVLNDIIERLDLEKRPRIGSLAGKLPNLLGSHNVVVWFVGTAAVPQRSNNRKKLTAWLDTEVTPYGHQTRIWTG